MCSGLWSHSTDQIRSPDSRLRFPAGRVAAAEVESNWMPNGLGSRLERLRCYFLQVYQGRLTESRLGSDRVPQLSVLLPGFVCRRSELCRTARFACG